MGDSGDGGVGYQAQRETYSGAGDAWATAFELAVTPAVFGFLGYRLDLWVASTPLFTIVFTVVALSYVVWKAYAAYEAEMKVHEARLFGRRATPPRSRPASRAA